MAISRRLRFEVLRRDDYRCRYCGAGPETELQVDHVVPEALGGSSQPENLVTACRACNAGKSSSAPDAPVVQAVSDDALRWAQAMQQAAEIQRQQRDEFDVYCDRFYNAWPPTYSLAHDWRNALEQWFKLGVEIELLLSCLDIAFGVREVEWRWKYFCGIVWNKVRERQDIARDLIAGDGE